MAKDINEVDISKEMSTEDYYLVSIGGKLRRISRKVVEALGDELWMRLDGTKPMTGPIAMGGNNITNLGDAVNDGDALALAFAKTLFAPSGLVSYKISDPTNEADLDAQLKAIFDGMPNDIVAYCAMTSSGSTTTFGGGRVTFEIFKQVGGYGVIKAVKYYSSGTQVDERQRLIFNNVWHSWEWVNPPMALGVEYRTTERLDGKVVYAQYINVGTATNGASMSNPSGATNIVRHQGYIGTIPLPIGSQYIQRTGYFAYTALRTDNKGIYLLTDNQSDGYGSGGYKWFEQVWYTK